MPKVKGNDIDICRQRWEEIQRLNKEARIHEAEYARLESSAEAFTHMVEVLAKENGRLKTVNAELRVMVDDYTERYLAHSGAGENGRLKAEVAELRMSVANQAGDDLCWLSAEHPEGVQIPPQAEFLESCRRFHAQISTQAGVIEGAKTIAQLEAEVAELSARNKRQCEDSMIAHRWFAQQFGEIMNGRDFGAKCSMATEEMRALHLRIIAVAEKLEGKQ